MQILWSGALAVFICPNQHFYHFFRNKTLTVGTHCNAQHCKACHNEQKLSRAKREDDAETGSDLVGRYTPSQFMKWLQMGTGKWQNRRELYRQAMPGQALSKAIRHVTESPGKAPSVWDFTSPECWWELSTAIPPSSQTLRQNPNQDGDEKNTAKLK